MDNCQNSEKGGPILTECDSSEDAERSSSHKRKTSIYKKKKKSRSVLTNARTAKTTKISLDSEGYTKSSHNEPPSVHSFI
jgi:hypothetical protein